MGMYDDYEDPSLVCPYCHEPIENMQGKDGPCVLAHYYIGDVMEDGWSTHTVFEVHDIHGFRGDDPHWIEGIGVIYEGRWIATIITHVRGMGDRTETLWSLVKE